MKSFSRFFLATVFGITSMTFAAIATETAAPATTTGIVATYKGGQVTEDALLKQAKSSLMKPMSQIYEIKKNALQNMIAEDLLTAEAKSLATTPEALLKKNSTDKITEPSEAELKALYEREKSSNKMLQGKDYKTSEPILKKIYTSQKAQELSQAYVESLFKKYEVSLILERPRSMVSTDDDPAIGPANAPIVIVEFSDFQCPYCKKTRPTIEKILTQYKDKVRYVFRDFPLSFHKQALDAASAANCAGEQKKYWEYNKELWNRQGDLKNGESVLKEIAKTLSLKTDAFDTCLQSKKYHAEIDKDQNEGAEAGASGTPAYFINGIFLNGAQPFEAFQEIIDEELARLQK